MGPKQDIWTDPMVVQWSQHLLDSYRRWRGQDLIPRSGAAEEQAQALFLAPVVVVSHGVERDPVLNYGNRMALDLWEMTWAQLVATPSRLTAEAGNREERARMLARVTVHGFVDDYGGVRVSGTGRRFLVDRAIVWNIVDDTGRRIGQAASFATWTYLDVDA